MSKFTIAYNKIMGHEGTYSNHRLDRGGETYRGVSRNHHPTWGGWQIIDDTKRSVAKEYDQDSVEFENEFVSRLEENQLLQYRIKEFYKKNYFDVFNGDNLPEQLAIELFDNAVNLGKNRAVKHLQRSLNVLNRNGLLYSDLIVDGIYGSMTEGAINRYLDIDGDEEMLVKVINILQGSYYLEIMKYDPTQEHFARGWLKRVTLDLS